MTDASCQPIPDNERTRALAARYPGAQTFIAGRDGALSIALVRDGRCVVFYEGETTPDQKMALFAQIKQAGITHIDTLLVDFSGFIGVIDWEYAKTQNNPVPGFDTPPSKAAYVAHDEMAAIALKGILSFAKDIEWRVFTRHNLAAAWLGWV